MTKTQRQMLAAAAASATLTASAQPVATHVNTPAGNRFDEAAAGVYARREADWRNGALVYQVLPDRFAPAADLDAKRHLYPAPKVLRRWDELPQRGTYLDSARLWSHEIQFWGGDLKSVASKLDHVQQLGADVLYLNPIHLAYTNHKYDAFDYQAVSPEFGTRDDVKALAKNVHARGMKLVLDGVFNHMGRNAPKFQDALANPQSPWRDWFYIGPQYQSGARVWWLAENLPEINLENPAVRAHVYAGQDSVVRSYLRDGVDGWRLDVAVDIGFEQLHALTQAAHAEKPGSLVVGEIANYPKEWFPAVDGVMNFTLREIILRVADRRLEPALAMQMIRPHGARKRHREPAQVLADAGQPRHPAHRHRAARRHAAPAGPGAAVHAARRAQPLLRQRSGHARRRRPRDARADALGPGERCQPDAMPGRRS